MRVRFDATGDVVVITGGANGIGAALAESSVQAGAKVIICDRDTAAAQSLCERESRIEFRSLDVSDRDAVMATIASVEHDHGKIDALVCGAAVQPRAVVHEMPPEEWRRTLAVNLDGVVWCYQAAVGGMIRRKAGVVLAFTSGLAASGWPGASAYAASKAALTAFVKSAAKEVAPYRVRVNLVSPGVIDTPQYREANVGQDAQYWQSTLGVGAPADVVGPLMFLLSDAATMTASVVSRDFAYPAEV